LIDARIWRNSPILFDTSNRHPQITPSSIDREVSPLGEKA